MWDGYYRELKDEQTLFRNLHIQILLYFNISLELNTENWDMIMNFLPDVNGEKMTHVSRKLHVPEAISVYEDCLRGRGLKRLSSERL